MMCPAQQVRMDTEGFRAEVQNKRCKNILYWQTLTIKYAMKSREEQHQHMSSLLCRRCIGKIPNPNAKRNRMSIIYSRNGCDLSTKHERICRAYISVYVLHVKILSGRTGVCVCVCALWSFKSFRRARDWMAIKSELYAISSLFTIFALFKCLVYVYVCILAVYRQYIVRFSSVAITHRQ